MGGLGSLRSLGPAFGGLLAHEDDEGPLRLPPAPKRCPAARSITYIYIHIYTYMHLTISFLFVHTYVSLHIYIYMYPRRRLNKITEAPERRAPGPQQYVK